MKMIKEKKVNSSSSQLSIDFNLITRIFNRAEEQGRFTLYEHETYELLKHSGAETPPSTHLIVKGSKPSDEELLLMPGEKVVLKVVSPAIIHKTEVGGVKVVDNKADKIRSAWRRMMYEVPETYASIIEKNADHGPEIYKHLSAVECHQACRTSVATASYRVLL